MRAYSIVGLLLIGLGILMLSIYSVTYFTTDQVSGPLGFFVWDVSRPHTIFIHPIGGFVAIAVGAALALADRRPRTA